MRVEKTWRCPRQSETFLPGFRVYSPLNASLLWVPTFICRIKKVKKKKKGNKMKACGALAASVRVLGCYQGLKIHPGGNSGQLRLRGGVKNTQQRKTVSQINV